jgi:uncharacterized protein with GYD domain
MPYYLLQVSETREGWDALMEVDLEKRIQYLTEKIEKMGGKLEGCWGAFGDYDWVLIYQMPDNINAAAFPIALLGIWSVKACKTTPLMTLKETATAIQKAAASGIEAPQ